MLDKIITPFFKVTLKPTIKYMLKHSWGRWILVSFVLILLICFGYYVFEMTFLSGNPSANEEVLIKEEVFEDRNTKEDNETNIRINQEVTINDNRQLEKINKSIVEKGEKEQCNRYLKIEFRGINEDDAVRLNSYLTSIEFSDNLKNKKLIIRKTDGVSFYLYDEKGVIIKKICDVNIKYGALIKKAIDEISSI